MRRSSTFLRVLRSYSKVEKILSICLLIVFVVFGGQYTKKTIGIGFDVGIGGNQSGIYTEGFPMSIARINPVYADLNEADRDISSLVFRGLTKYDPDSQNIIGDMADVTISEDKLTYTFVLKSYISWHDGEIFDADDVYFTIHDIIQHPDFQNPILKANFSGVEVKKIDQKTIEFVLTAPNSFFITNTTVGILPEHLLANVSPGDLFMDDFNQDPIGTGPYKVSSKLKTNLKGVTEVILETFDDYYGPRPQVDKIRFFGYPTRSDLIANKDSINAIPKLTDEMVKVVSDDPRFSLYGYSLPQYNAVFFNLNNELLKSDKVREAMQKAVFKDAFLDQIQNAIRVETPVVSFDQDDWKYDASMDDAKKLLEDAGFDEFIEAENINVEEVVTIEAEDGDEEPEGIDTDIVAEEVETDSAESESTPVVTQEETPATENVEVSEEIFTPSYRKNQVDQILDFRLVARLYPEGTYKFEETQMVLNYLQTKWAQAGVRINIELYDSATLQEKIRTRDYDLLLFGQGLGYNQDLYGYWHSTQASETGLNLSNYKSFKADTLIEAIRGTFDDEEKSKKLEALAESIRDDRPAIFLYR
ncbi:hypothetical protein KKD70_00200, partial [Patescibacteria group bacterium]|nr:hypothetical protein [Patescibacteria group bacterium]